MSSLTEWKKINGRQYYLNLGKKIGLYERENLDGENLDEERYCSLNFKISLREMRSYEYHEGGSWRYDLELEDMVEDDQHMYDLRRVLAFKDGKFSTYLGACCRSFGSVWAWAYSIFSFHLGHILSMAASLLGSSFTDSLISLATDLPRRESSGVRT